MNNKQKKLLITAGALAITMGIVLGGIGLYDKWNKVNELNDQIAAVDESQKHNDEDKSTNKPAEEVDVEPGSSGAVSTKHPSASLDPMTTTQPITTPLVSPTPTHIPAATKPPTDKPGSTPIASPVTPEEKEKLKEMIDAAITIEMAQLRAACKASSNDLVAQIVVDLKSNPDAALDTIQKKFLTQIVTAEAECDEKFQVLLSKAKELYKADDIGVESLPNWSAEFEIEKGKARSDALVQISNALE